MKINKVIVWDVTFLLVTILFLLTKNWGRYNLIIGFETVLIFVFSLKFHFDYFKQSKKIY